MQVKVNVNKTKIMVFRKGGILPRNLAFFYNELQLEKVSKFRYLGVVLQLVALFQRRKTH